MQGDQQNAPDLPPARALVMFGDRADLPWLRLLKRGYRHCFVVIEGQVPEGDGAVWMVYNPLSHCTELAIVAGLDGSAIATHYRAQGYRVLETRLIQPPKRSAPWRPYTCVEAVKRVLGLHAPAVFTPWQLHDYIFRKINLFNP